MNYLIHIGLVITVISCSAAIFLGMNSAPKEIAKPLDPASFDLSRNGCVVTGPDGKRLTFDAKNAKIGDQFLIPKGSRIEGDCRRDN